MVREEKEKRRKISKGEKVWGEQAGQGKEKGKKERKRKPVLGVKTISFYLINFFRIL